MIFRPELAEKIMRGEKTVTRRLVSDNPRSPWWVKRCAYRVGQGFPVQPGRGKAGIGRARVLDIRMEMLGNVTEDEASREGFSSIAEMDTFRQLRPLANGWDSVWRIEFEVTDVA